MTLPSSHKNQVVILQKMRHLWAISYLNIYKSPC